MYQQVFDLHAELLKALAHPKRLEIIHLLRDQSLSVSQIQNMLDLPQANLSQHLQILRQAKVLGCNKQGKQIYYHVSHTNFIKACDLLREFLIETSPDSALCDELKLKMSQLVPITTDPVCGMRISPKTASFSISHKDQQYFFCASGCLRDFKIKNHLK